MKFSHVCSAFVFLSAAFISGVAGERKNWALLVAGTEGYANYRHQAGVCHAYQILHKWGIPDEQIVVMMFDDIANNSLNPVQGNIINKPDGPNVYPGVPKDYTRYEVTADAFVKVLLGDSEGVHKLLGRSGKVINSGPEDHVFVYFTDNGGYGILEMPGAGHLPGSSLVKALYEMHSKKKFAKLTFYLDTDNAGSMFRDGLHDDISVYATTSSGRNEQNHASYCDTDRGACLGSLFSVSWMENSDTADLHTETLEQQYEIVKKRVALSNVQQFGDTSFTSLVVGQFLSNLTTNPSDKSRLKMTQLQDRIHDVSTVDSTMGSILTYRRLLTSQHPRHVARRADIYNMYKSELWIQSQTRQVLTDIARRVYRTRAVSDVMDQAPSVHDWDCYFRSVDRLMERCARMESSTNNFVLSQLTVLVNLCNNKPQAAIHQAIDHVTEASQFCR